MSVKYSPKHCVHCHTRLKGGTGTYDLGVCSYCLNTLPQYLELKKTYQALRYQKFYERNTEKEKQRAVLNRQKAKS